MTFLKVAADLKEGAEIKSGDVISLASNVAGIVASFAILAGAPLIAGGATVVGVTATLYSIFNSDLAKAAYDKMAPLFTSLLSQGDLTGFTAPRIAPDFTLASPDQILSTHQGMITTVNWNPDSSEISLGTEPLSFPDIHIGSLRRGGFYRLARSTDPAAHCYSICSYLDCPGCRQ